MSSDFYVDNNSVSELSGILGMTVLIIGIIGFIMSVLTLVSMWKIYKKAGKPGWGSIVPFYSQYLLFDMTFGKGWYFLLLFVPIVGIVYMIMLPLKLASAFGKSSAFGCGLLFLPFIFYPILAFGNSRFQNKGFIVNHVENHTTTPKVEYNNDPIMPPRELNPALASLNIPPREPSPENTQVNNIESQVNDQPQENSISDLTYQTPEVNNQGFGFTNYQKEEIVTPKQDDNTLNLSDLISATMVESNTFSPALEEQPQPVIIPDQDELRKN